MSAFRIASLGSFLVALLAACGSTGAGAGPAASSSASSTLANPQAGACIDHDQGDSALSYCIEYDPGSGPLLAALQSSCTTMPPSGYRTVWQDVCPPGARNGCRYPPDAFGGIGPTVVFYYQSAGGCLGQGVEFVGDAGTDAE
jgi:hypothetical protein